MAKKKPVASKSLANATNPRTKKPYSTQKAGTVTAKMMSDMAPGAKKNKMFGKMKMPKGAPF